MAWGCCLDSTLRADAPALTGRCAGAHAAYFLPAFFLPAMVLRGPLLERALVLVR